MKLKVRVGNYYEVGDDRRLKMQLCPLSYFLDFEFWITGGNPVCSILLLHLYFLKAWKRINGYYLL